MTPPKGFRGLDIVDPNAPVTVKEYTGAGKNGAPNIGESVIHIQGFQWFRLLGFEGYAAITFPGVGAASEILGMYLIEGIVPKTTAGLTAYDWQSGFDRIAYNQRFGHLNCNAGPTTGFMYISGARRPFCTFRDGSFAIQPDVQIADAWHSKEVSVPDRIFVGDHSLVFLYALDGSNTMDSSNAPETRIRLWVEGVTKDQT